MEAFYKREKAKITGELVPKVTLIGGKECYQFAKAAQHLFDDNWTPLNDEGLAALTKILRMGGYFHTDWVIPEA